MPIINKSKSNKNQSVNNPKGILGRDREIFLEDQKLSEKLVFEQRTEPTL